MVVLRIPTLAIHLDRQETFSFNKESQLFPIAGLVAAELNKRPCPSDAPKDSNTPFQPLKVITERHHPVIVEEIAKAAGEGLKPEDVVDFEALLYDTQKSVIGGINNELIFSARLDNLMMSFCSVIGLLEAVKPKEDEDDPSISLISLFDHEEIGSLTTQGADSNLLPSVIRRLSVLLCKQGSQSSKESPRSMGDSTAYEQTLSTSFLVSADMAHGVHPNYAAKYESDHRPELNNGTVIKVNANARYATNSPGIALLQEVARLADDRKGVPLQLFVVRNDSSCGGTIGPMLSAALGVRTLDLGNPQLSMHSIRETGGAHDVENAVKLFRSFFVHYPEVHKRIIVD
jgi:aspartyl aminopeptidase